MLILNTLLDSGNGNSDSSGNLYTWVIFGVLAIALIFMVIVPMFTNKKEKDNLAEAKRTFCVGDTVLTAGGIIGKVVEIRETPAGDREFVLETGTEDCKSYVRFDPRAFYQIISRGEEYLRKQAEEAAAAAAQAEASEVAEEVAQEVDEEVPPTAEQEEIPVEEDKKEE